MKQAGCPEPAIRAFQRAVELVRAGASPTLAETEIEPVHRLPRLDELDSSGDAPIQQAVVIKLNGGLGTSMGLRRAKSLLRVRGEETFLDLIAAQVKHQRARHPGLRFLLMNSFATRDDSLGALPDDLGAADSLDFLQNKVPKLRASDLEPVEVPDAPELEWCPPGHGDLYTALLASGRLDELLEAGIRYAFVSNSDNLGATLDPRILTAFARSGAPLLMEVTRRTPADRKGGHLARMAGSLVLRESAMCAPEDRDSFQDIDRHRFFNTNNLWVRLDALAEALAANDGVLPLPIIQNRKTVDPRDPDSTPVIQLETAMGSAITCFSDAQAVEVPRSRFAPVKKTSDLLAVRSDAYRRTPDHRLVLDVPSPPVIHLDNHLKHIDQLDRAIPRPPGLRNCASLTLEGPIRLDQGVVFEGEVVVRCHGNVAQTLPAGVYKDQTVEL